MPSMTKKVNINAPVAIRNITPPIYGTCNNIIMSTGDILKCLCKRAVVDEILPDGSTIRLTMKNYYLDNGAGLDAKKSESAISKETEKGNYEPNNDIAVEVEETRSEIVASADVVSEDYTEYVTDPAIMKIEEVTESTNSIESNDTVFVSGLTIVDDTSIDTDSVTTSATTEDNKEIKKTTSKKKTNSSKKKISTAESK